MQEAPVSFSIEIAVFRDLFRPPTVDTDIICLGFRDAWEENTSRTIQHIFARCPGCTPRFPGAGFCLLVSPEYEYDLHVDIVTEIDLSKVDYSDAHAIGY